MPTMVWRFLASAAVGIGFGAFGTGIVAYFVFSVGPDGMRDGLERPLTEAPLLARWLLGAEREWAGWGWFAFDMVWFWTCIAAAFGLYTVADDKMPPSVDTSASALTKVLMFATGTAAAYGTFSVVKWAVGALQ